jgi:hypothetical protein
MISATFLGMGASDAMILLGAHDIHDHRQSPAHVLPVVGPPRFQGGPGATGWSYSSVEEIIDSVRGKLLVLPGDTTMRTDHGDSRSIGAELPHLENQCSMLVLHWAGDRAREHRYP